MAIELFGFPGTRTSRVQWLLEELGLDYEYRKLAIFEGEHKREPYTKRHPHGKVPALQDGELQLIESAAMLMHYADKAGKLAPALGSDDRARYYQFIVYAVATLDDPAVQYYFHTVMLPEERRDAAKAEAAKPTLDTAVGLLGQALGEGEYLVGDGFTAADVAVGYDLHLMAAAGLLDGAEGLAAYYERLSARPAFQKVFAK